MMPAYPSHEQALKIVQSVLKTNGPCTAELLSGGLSGSELIKVNTSDRAYVVRFWNKKWAEDFPQDLACQVVASDAGYGPRVFFTDEAAYVTVIEYFHPEVFPEIRTRLQALVDLLKRIHTGPPVPMGIDKPTYLDECIEEVEKLNLQLFDLDVIREIKEAVTTAARQNARCLPCHRDLHPGNLIYSQERFVAIDYTWGGMDDPYLDLATLAIFNCTTPEEEHLLLQLYLGHAPSPAEAARLSLMKLSAKLFYGLEFLKLAPTYRRTTTPKSYKNIEFHSREPLNPANFFEYASSLLGEVVDYSHSEQYVKDLALLQK